MKKLLLLFVLFGSAHVMSAQTTGTSAPHGQPVEVGLVNWNRDFEGALQRSGSENRPVLALFQEVPGCSGTREFGKEVLSHPLLVEAVEHEFIPVLIYNNRDGRDAELLARYSEPAWNYQVIRFFDSSGRDIIPRRDRIWTLGAVAGRMSEALTASGKNVPLYLRGLALEHDNPYIKEAAFAMFCHWTGERLLGGIEGVIKTETGSVHRREVTRVWYDERLISMKDLVQKAAELKCADVVYAGTRKEREQSAFPLNTEVFDEKTYRKAAVSDQKKQLQGTPFEHLNLTQYQRAKVNAFVRTNREKAMTYLSPRQTCRLYNLLQPDSGTRREDYIRMRGKGLKA